MDHGSGQAGSPAQPVDQNMFGLEVFAIEVDIRLRSVAPIVRLISLGQVKFATQFYPRFKVKTFRNF